ncbi:MAG TPA: hypothetical protein VHG89_04775 [Verrucomicrobiae bacterium]|nr:hypothetical protein [Verrucomicrobiae bacterium]
MNQIQPSNLLPASEDLCGLLESQLLWNAEENADIIAALKSLRAAITQAKGRGQRNAKTFLVTAHIQDGESERYDHALVSARNFQSAEKKADALFASRHGLDTDKAYFGRRGETYSQLDDLKEISAADAEVLLRLSLVHYA